MKKTLWIAALAACTMMSCGGNNANTAKDSNDSTAEGEARVEVKGHTASTNIAWLEYDSIMSQYEMYKFYKNLTDTKMAETQETLEKKAKEVQSLMQSTQQKYENGGFSTKTELENAQRRVEAKQQEYAKLEYELGAALESENMRITNEINDSIRSFLNDYVAQHGYDYILPKSGNSLLYANPELDVTEDVINGLNKRYAANKE